MAAALILELEALPDGWRVALRRAEGAAVVGHLAAAELRQLRATLAACRAPGGLVPTDADHTAAEERAGSALFAVIRGTPALLALWSETLGAAAPEPVLIAVSAPDPAIAELPWELLGDQVPLEAEGRGTVVRLLPGPPERPALPWSLQLWAPPPEHAALGRAMEASAARLPARPGTLLLAAGHGEVDAEGRFVAVGHGAAPRLVHGLDPASLRLVAFLSCHADGPQAGRSLAARLLAAGTEAVLAPGGRLDLDAAATFQGALVEGLAEGQGLARAVMAARRAVAALALPHGDGRWHRLRLSCVRLQGLMDPADTTAFKLWPTPSPAARIVLQAAEDRARRQGLGFVGVEHLMEAFREGLSAEALALEPGLVTRQARIRNGGARWREELWGLWADGTGQTPRLTPRLHRLALHLHPGFTACELFEVLAQHAVGPVVRWLDTLLPPPPTPGGATAPSLVGPMGPHQASDAATGLECVGGPDDGLRIFPEPNDTIGRDHSAGAPNHPLQRGSARDMHTSRQHLRWEGPGRLQVLKRRTWLLPERLPIEAGATLPLLPGTTLCLGGGTWLVGVTPDLRDAEQ